jgi:hypothetical protein
MDLKTYLKNGTHYDDNSRNILLRDCKNRNDVNLFLNVRGWGHIQYLFDNEHDAYDFHDSIGEFVAQAVNEKIERDFNKKEQDT